VDPETLNLLQKAIREGISSASWTMLITAVISAGFGAFLGSYLQRKGEDLAMNENFKEVKKQVTDLAQITEGIKQRSAIELKEMDRIQAQHVFVRELYAPSVREYSSEQAVGLREAYLLLFEPGSSLTYSAGKHFEERLDLAIRSVMQPFRKHLGVLDEETHGKIYSVQNYLLELKGKDPEDVKKKMNEFLNLTEEARKSVKANKIAYRLGLIDRPLKERAEKE
jgi:hypothetical protein